jgi:hypothetical protein
MSGLVCRSGRFWTHGLEGSIEEGPEVRDKMGMCVFHVWQCDEAGWDFLFRIPATMVRGCQTKSRLLHACAYFIKKFARWRLFSQSLDLSLSVMYIIGVG